ncbi:MULTISPECIES: hypothetical protein [Streptomyces]|uniref:hypothetical protein n=1 Tax=Streptomyces TaxID=1883 RepID=UPI00073DF87B|nr:hypothetical protein [Streptomyces sp. FBKL.4005]MYU28669.1 hypothetical protein [Streptomyces sp. SID7810]OYP17062.1 hypothetical protein CFC35_23245 [Streptomyces sp. FBKL.4005]CUW29709.1 hypothetical protein TUE45_04418 [Streptomyces reticuli]
MATFGYAQLPVPGGGDGPTMPGHLADLAEAIDPHLWQHANDLADRNTKYSAAPAQTVVVALDGTTWIKVSSSSNIWVTVWEPLADWQPLALASGYEPGQTTPEARIDRGQVHLRGTIQRTDNGLIPTSGGVKLGTVPDECIPQQIARFDGGASLTGDAMTGVCRIEVFSPDQDANSLGARGSLVAYSQDGSHDSGTPGLMWVDISGYYWLD